MSDWKINGSGMSIAPVGSFWVPPTIGIALTGRGVYSSFYNVELTFAGGCVADTWQWIDAVSAGSFNATILARDEIAFTDTSGVYAEIVQWPKIEGTITGEFVILLRGVL
jgi:hypothetical protein